MIPWFYVFEKYLKLKALARKYAINMKENIYLFIIMTDFTIDNNSNNNNN